MTDHTIDSLLRNEIIIEMASELPSDTSEWDTKYFHIHAAEEARDRGLDPNYTETMIATAIRRLASN